MEIATWKRQFWKIVLIMVTCVWTLHADISVYASSKDEYVPLYGKTEKLPMKAGEYATAYSWLPESLRFAQNFAMADISGLTEADTNTTSRFRSPLAYVWLAGFYKSEIKENGFARWAYRHRGKATINKRPLHVEGGEDEFYYDLCDKTTRKKRVEYLAMEAKKRGFGGFFFDWGNAIFLEEPEFSGLKKEMERRGHMPYEKCIAKFLRELKAKSGLKIVTNQGYRNPEILREVDYDMVESYLTTNEGEGENEKTVYTSDKEEILWYFEYLADLKEDAAPYGFKNFIYMNYAAPKRNGKVLRAPKGDIAYNYAMSKLAGFIPYTEVPSNRELEFSNLYFYDLGDRISVNFSSEPAMGEFENGIVLVMTSIEEPAYIKISGVYKDIFYDVIEDVWIKPDKNGDAVVKFSPRYDTKGEKYLPVAKILICKAEQ